jgi:hypothetical protein
LVCVEGIAGVQIAGTSPQGFFFELLQSVLGNPLLASFLCSGLEVCAVLTLLYPLYRKSIYIRLLTISIINRKKPNYLHTFFGAAAL